MEWNVILQCEQMIAGNNMLQDTKAVVVCSIERNVMQFGYPVIVDLTDLPTSLGRKILRRSTLSEQQLKWNAQRKRRGPVAQTDLYSGEEPIILSINLISNKQNMYWESCSIPRSIGGNSKILLGDYFALEYFTLSLFHLGNYIVLGLILWWFPDTFHFEVKMMTVSCYHTNCLDLWTDYCE